MTDDIDCGRRSVLAGAVAAALSTTALPTARAVSGLAESGTPEGEPDRSVFPQGIASGDPTPEGVVLWTRVDPGATRSDEPLRLTVTDETDGEQVGAWRVPGEAVGEDDHTVKVDLDGALEPSRRYRYRFGYDGASSTVGRFRTLPAPGASPDSVRVAVLTCQDYRNGYYGAYRHVAEESLDCLVHLGDFVYEHGGPSGYPGRSLSLPSGNGITMGLDDYRYLHRTYRTDPALQAALAAHALVPTWDDHEIVNNRYWDYEEGRPYAGRGDHPRNDDGAFMTQLFADGIRAWWEYMPVRVPYDPDAESLLDSLTLWRGLRFGDLVELLVTDERLYRTSPTDGTQFAARVGDGGDLDETMLGRRQREWFRDRLENSGTTWTAWANEVLAMEFDLELWDVDLLNADAWDGFAAERRRVLDSAAEGDATLVALTGDMHSALAGYVRHDDERVGVEFMTPAVTSQNLRELLDLEDDPFVRRFIEAQVTEENPHVEFFDSHHWGYSVVEFTPNACTYTAYAVDKASREPGSKRRLARYRCPSDRIDLQEQ